MVVDFDMDSDGEEKDVMPKCHTRGSVRRILAPSILLLKFDQLNSVVLKNTDNADVMVVPRHTGHQ